MRSYFTARPPAVSRHVCTNVVVTVQGDDDAACTSLAMLYRAQPTATPGPAPLGGALGIVEYSDTLVRTPEGWRIRRREAQLVFAAVPATGAAS